VYDITPDKWYSQDYPPKLQYIIKHCPVCKQRFDLDPDGDLVRIRYSNPVNRRTGTWQTDYEDRGNYEVYISVTDGDKTSTQKTEFRINSVNRKPTIEAPMLMKVNEAQELS